MRGGGGRARKGVDADIGEGQIVTVGGWQRT